MYGNFMDCVNDFNSWFVKGLVMLINSIVFLDIMEYIGKR